MGRPIFDTLYKACLYSGIIIESVNSLDNAAYWSYSLLPMSPITASDQLWMSRYILMRVAEDFKVSVSFAPETIPN